MKMRRGVDASQLKQFLFPKLEKIGFGVSMFLAAMFLYGALRQTPYEKTPDDLRRSITKAKENIQKEDEIPGPQRPAKPRFLQVAQRAKDHVRGEDFRFVNTFHRVNINIGTKRGEPEYLAVRELEVTSGVASFALKADRAAVIQANRADNHPDRAAGQAGRAGPRRPGARKTEQGRLREMFNPGGEQDVPAMPKDIGAIPAPRGVQAPAESVVEGVRWLCVTGLVPYREQREKFYNEFNSARYTDPIKDEPCWITFLVERAEVPAADAKDAKPWTWERISVSRARDFANTWAVRAGDVVDPVYIDENLTFPLGPMLARNWGKEATHSKIPLLDATERGAMSAPSTPTEPDNIADADKKTEDDDIAAALKKRHDRMKAGAPGMSPPRMVVPRTSGAATTPSTMPRGSVAGRYPSRMLPRQASGGDLAEPQDVEYLLFRFFDFTVEEGKRYSYRVQLVLANPNEDIRRQYLKDASLAEDSYKLSPVSEPSPVASVSGYNYLLAGRVRAAEKPIDEPKVSMIAVQLDPKTGGKAAYEMRPRRPGSPEEAKRPLARIERGQVIKFNANVHMVHPITRHVEKREVAFNSNMVLVDIKGGEPFAPGSLKDHDTMPGEVLLMDSHGELHSQSETAHESDYMLEEQYLKQLDEAEANNTASPPGGSPAR